MTFAATRASVPPMKIGVSGTATVAGVALLFAAAGCGPSNSGPTVGTCGVLPCGGDVVGNWTAASSCMDEAIFMEDFVGALRGNCAGAAVDNIAMNPRGTLAMTADMNFTGVLDVDTTFDLIFPPTCYPNASCAEVETVTRAMVGAGIMSVDCVDTVGKPGCTCTMGLVLPVMNNTGTWATSGTTLTFGLPMVDGPYCVEGSSLHLVGYGTSPTTKTKIVSDLVLTKQ